MGLYEPAIALPHFLYYSQSEKRIFLFKVKVQYNEKKKKN